MTRVIYVENMMNRIDGCPNCIESSKGTNHFASDINFYDAVCLRCEARYKLTLKYPTYETNKKVIDFINQSESSIKELSFKHKIPIVDIVAFYESPTFYNCNMYRLAALVLDTSVEEVSSFNLVDEETYNKGRNKILKQIMKKQIA